MVQCSSRDIKSRIMNEQSIIFSLTDIHVLCLTSMVVYYNIDYADSVPSAEDYLRGCRERGDSGRLLVQASARLFMDMSSDC